MAEKKKKWKADLLRWKHFPRKKCWRATGKGEFGPEKWQIELSDDHLDRDVYVVQEGHGPKHVQPIARMRTLARAKKLAQMAYEG